jgi:hypothetical protein
MREVILLKFNGRYRLQITIQGRGLPGKASDASSTTPAAQPPSGLRRAPLRSRINRPPQRTLSCPPTARKLLGASLPLESPATTVQPGQELGPIDDSDLARISSSFSALEDRLQAVLSKAPGERETIPAPEPPAPPAPPGLKAPPLRVEIPRQEEAELAPSSSVPSTPRGRSLVRDRRSR